MFVQAPFEFEQVWNRASTISLQGHAIGLISLPDLIEMKRSAGRTRDLEDIEALQRLERKDSHEK